MSKPRANLMSQHRAVEKAIVARVKETKSAFFKVRDLDINLSRARVADSVDYLIFHHGVQRVPGYWGLYNFQKPLFSNSGLIKKPETLPQPYSRA